MRTIRVAAERPYDVTIGHGAAAGLADAVAGFVGAAGTGDTGGAACGGG